MRRGDATHKMKTDRAIRWSHLALVRRTHSRTLKGSSGHSFNLKPGVIGSSPRTRLQQYLYLLPPRPMRRLLPFLACLMLVLTAWVGVAHAAEVGGCIETSQYEAASHVDGDGDQVAADTDKGYPHHHGSCHAHHMSAPDADTLPGTTGPTGSMLAFGAEATLVGRDADTALRPPRA